MIVFEFKMKQNGKFLQRAGTRKRRIVAMYERDVKKRFVDKTFECKLTGDLTAVIICQKMSVHDTHVLVRKSDDFGGYKYMLDSLLKTGSIKPIMPPPADMKEGTPYGLLLRTVDEDGM